MSALLEFTLFIIFIKVGINLTEKISCSIYKNKAQKHSVFIYAARLGFPQEDKPNGNTSLKT